MNFFYVVDPTNLFIKAKQMYHNLDLKTIRSVQWAENVTPRILVDWGNRLTFHGATAGFTANCVASNSPEYVMIQIGCKFERMTSDSASFVAKYQSLASLFSI